MGKKMKLPLPLRALILFTLINVASASELLGAGLPLDNTGDAYDQNIIKDVSSSSRCEFQCTTEVTYPNQNAPFRGYSYNSGTWRCFCWSGGSSSIDSVDNSLAIIYGDVYCHAAGKCDGSEEEPYDGGGSSDAGEVPGTSEGQQGVDSSGVGLFSSTNTTANTTMNTNMITVGPSNTTQLTMSLYGILELNSTEDVEEWAQLTAAFTMNYFNSGGFQNVSETIVDIKVDSQETVFAVGEDFCGCPQCTADIWSSNACDNMGFCSPCGARITYLQGGGKTKREACSQIAGLEHADTCGNCDPLTCTAENHMCGCPQCTAEVWNAMTCDSDGFCSSCGERISYLHSLGNLERDACIQIAGIEYGDPCGACNPLNCTDVSTRCGCASCTEEVWNTEACEDGYCSTCGDRIDFLEMLGGTSQEACIQVGGNEHGDVCGACNPMLCNEEPPSHTEPSDVSVFFTYTQTSTYKTTNPDLYTPSFVAQKPFAERSSRLDYVAYLQSRSFNYDDVVSSSPVIPAPPPPPPPPPAPKSKSPLGVRDYIIIAVAAVFAMAIFVRECMKRDKYAEGVAEGPRQHPLEETDDLEENDENFPTIPEESDDEEDSDDDDDDDDYDDDDDDDDVDDSPIYSKGATDLENGEDTPPQDHPFSNKEGRRVKLQVHPARTLSPVNGSASASQTSYVSGH